MATIYVDSNAVGLNNGTSWANAYTSITNAGVTGAASGDIIKIEKRHAETLTGAYTAANGSTTAPLYWLCCDKDNADALTRMSTSTGTITANLASTVVWQFGNYGYIYGLKFSCSNQVMNMAPTGRTYLENCDFVAPGSSSAIRTGTGRQTFVNCTFDCGAGSAGNTPVVQQLSTNAQRVELINCTLTARSNGTQDYFIGASAAGSQSGQEITLVNCKLVNNVDVALLHHGAATANASGIVVNFINCELPSSFVTELTTSGTQADLTFIRLIGCAAGTISAPANVNTWLYGFGAQRQVSTPYRNGGAHDGYGPYSWKIDTGAGTAENTLSSFETLTFSRFLRAGSHTITVYLASGITLQDDEVELHLFSPSEAGSPTAQGVFFESGKPWQSGTAADLTTDSDSTWTGSGVGTKQKIERTINPTVDGWVTGQIIVYRPSITLYVDPVIYSSREGGHGLDVCIAGVVERAASWVHASLPLPLVTAPRRGGAVMRM